MRIIESPFIGAPFTPANPPLIVDEVMLREPNLLVPGKKPVGPVKIDWSIPLTDQLNRLHVFTNGVVYDISAYRSPNIDSHTTIVGPGGLGVNYNGSQYSSYNLPLIGGFPGGGSFGDITGLSTIAVLMSSTSTGNGQWIYSASESTDNDPIYGVQQNISVAGVYSRGNLAADVHFSLTGTSTINDGKPHMIVCRGSRLSGGTSYLYVDGIQEDSTAVSTGQVDYDREAIGALVRATVGSYYTGNVYMCAAWDRQLSDNEVKSFSADPYQFLIPA